MAIYHLSVKTISRSAGRSATAAAAYRAGVEILDTRTGEVHDYRRKGGVEHSEIVLPKDAPDWARDRAALWNAAEVAEVRKNSTVAREFEIALPSELSGEARRTLAVDFAREIVARHGCAVDVAIHEPGREGDSRNHHAHLLLTTRRLGAEGFTDKTRELDQRQSGEVDYWRSRYAELQNERLQDAGLSVRVDHRSLKAQGVDREPTKHLGVGAVGYERRTGQASRRRITHEAEISERLQLAKEAGEFSRAGAVLDQTILDLSGDLERAKAERSQQVSDKYGLKAAAQAVERLNALGPTGQEPAKKLTIANLYGVEAAPHPEEKTEVAEVERKPEPTIEQAKSEHGWGVKIAGLKPVSEGQRVNPLRDQQTDPEILKRAAAAQRDTARFVPNQGWVNDGKTQEEEAAGRVTAARRLMEQQRLEAEQQNAARQRESALEQQYAQHLAQIKRSYLDWLVAKHTAKLEQAEREQREHRAKKPLVIGVRAWEEQHRLKGFAVDRAATDQRDALRHQNNPNLTGPFVYGEQRPEDYAARAMRERHPELTQEVERIKSERVAKARAEEQRIWKANIDKQLAENAPAPKRGPPRR